MNFFIKILDEIKLERVSDYTAWMIADWMKRYTSEQKHYMWERIYNSWN